MSNWAYYKMVRLDEPEVPKSSSFDELKERVSKYKYAIMDEGGERVDWFETYEIAEEVLNCVKKGRTNEWYITEVTEEMREKLLIHSI